MTICLIGLVVAAAFGVPVAPADVVGLALGEAEGPVEPVARGSGEADTSADVVEDGVAAVTTGRGPDPTVAPPSQLDSDSDAMTSRVKAGKGDDKRDDIGLRYPRPVKVRL